MLNRILVRVIDEQNYARHVIQTDVISSAPFDVAESDGNRWFDGKIIIGDSIRMADKDVVIINPSDGDRKSTRLNSSHVAISYAVFCLKKKKKKINKKQYITIKVRLIRDQRSISE